MMACRLLLLFLVCCKTLTTVVGFHSFHQQQRHQTLLDRHNLPSSRAQTFSGSRSQLSSSYFSVVSNSRFLNGSGPKGRTLRAYRAWQCARDAFSKVRFRPRFRNSGGNATRNLLGWSIRSVTSLFLVCLAMSLSSTAAIASTGISHDPASAMATTTRAVMTVPLPQDCPISTAKQLQLSLQLFFAALTGAAIGKERSGIRYQSAGVRTMSLVSTGAALFTICSRHGFAGTHYDTSRMASNVASGVGFIGAGVIYHEQCSEVVHGLTTAAAIWISAAVGVACGTGLYIVATMATGLTLAILRVGGAVKRRGKKRKKRKVDPDKVKWREPQESLRMSSNHSTDLSSPIPSPTFSHVFRDDDFDKTARLLKQLPSTDWSEFIAEDDKVRTILLKNLNEVSLWNNQTRGSAAP